MSISLHFYQNLNLLNLFSIPSSSSFSNSVCSSTEFVPDGVLLSLHSHIPTYICMQKFWISNDMFVFKEQFLKVFRIFVKNNFFVRPHPFFYYFSNIKGLIKGVLQVR